MWKYGWGYIENYSYASDNVYVYLNKMWHSHAEFAILRVF